MLKPKRGGASANCSRIAESGGCSSTRGYRSRYSSHNRPKRPACSPSIGSNWTEQATSTTGGFAYSGSSRAASGRGVTALRVERGRWTNGSFPSSYPDGRGYGEPTTNLKLLRTPACSVPGAFRDPSGSPSGHLSGDVWRTCGGRPVDVSGRVFRATVMSTCENSHKPQEQQSCRTGPGQRCDLPPAPASGLAYSKCVQSRAAPCQRLRQTLTRRSR